MRETSVPEGTLKEKIRLLYGQNKGYLYAAAAAVILAACLLIAGLTAKETVLTGVLLGLPEETPEEMPQSLASGFLDSLELDPSVAKVRLVTDLPFSAEVSGNSLVDNFTAIDTLTEYISDGLVDFLMGDTASMETLAYSDFFEDLRQILTPEQLEALEGRIRYMDLGVVRQLEEMAESKTYPENFTLPDPAKPELMEEPVPVFIDVSRSSCLKDLYPEDALLAVAQNSSHLGTVRAFVDYLMSHSPAA